MVKIFIKKFFKIKSEKKKRKKETSLVIFHPLQWWLGLCRSPQLLSLPSPTKISAIEASQSLFNWWVPQPFLLEIQWWVKFYGNLKRIKLYHVKCNFLRIRLRLVLVAREWLRWTLKRNFKNKNNKKRKEKKNSNLYPIVIVDLGIFFFFLNFGNSKWDKDWICFIVTHLNLRNWWKIHY